MIERRIQRVGETPGVDDSPPITVDDLVSTPRSGLLVAEGGMGKSTFLRDFADRVGNKAVFVKLAYFAQNPQWLLSEIERMLEKSASDCTLILDGLDEALDLVGTICWRCQNLPDTIHVWIASRECRQLLSIHEELKKLVRYRLLPLSDDDIKARAREESLEVVAVESVLQKHALWQICGNPQGCDFVLKAFKQSNRQGAWTSQEIWRQGILSLCDETDSETKPLDKNAGRFSVDQIYACATWIALNLILSGKNAVFTGIRETDCPPSALPEAALEDGKGISRGLIEIALQRGVFTAWIGNQGCSEFAHAIYGDYLAAEGFRRHVPRGQWESLLLDRKNRCLFAQRIGVAQWLMTDDAALADQVFELSPESFLTRDLARLKMNGLCRALLNRAALVFGQLWRGNGFSLGVLKSPETLKVLQDFLFTSDSPSDMWAVELAVDIARACEYWELLADFAVNDTRDETRRQDAVFALNHCQDIEIKRRLRPLLDRLADKSDRWRGALLSVCWPDVLTVDEVLPFVVRPHSFSMAETSGYRAFLRYNFLGPLFERLQPAVSDKPLIWANTWLKESSGNFVVDNVKKGARAVYTRFWNYAAASGTDPLVALLADGYLAANKRYESPFFPDSDAELFGRCRLPPECKWTRDAFTGQRELRFAVLREIIARRALKSMSGIALGMDGALIQDEDDLVRVSDIILAAPYDANTEQWGLLLRYSRSRHFLKTKSELVDRMHVARPDLFPLTSLEILAEAEHSRKEREETERKQKDALGKDAAKWADWQQQVDRRIKDDLSIDNTPPELFAGICTCLYAEKGDFGDWDNLDFRQAVGWKKLSDVEQERLIRLAERFLREAPPPPEDAEARGSDLVWHRALLTLKRVRPDGYEKLSEAVWRKCVVELLRFHVNDACQELYDDLARKFPAVAGDALIRCLPYEYGGGVLNAWEGRLTEAQAEAVFDAWFGSVSCGIDDALAVRCFNQFPSDRCTSVGTPFCDQVLSGLAQYQPDVVRRWVNERMKNDFAIHLGHPFYDVLRLYALQLDADRYFSSFLQTLTQETEWGRRWLERSADALAWYDKGVFRNAFFSRSADEIGKIYEWFDSQYPPEEKPRHESAAAYTPSIFDHIYRFKDDLLRVLYETGKKGSARVVESLIAKCSGILEGYAEAARRNEAAARLPELSPNQIRELLKKKKSVIASVSDLQRYILGLLQDYQKSLHGNTTVVGRLWNTNKPVEPKTENESSLEMLAFLKDKMAGAIFANREVPINLKLAEGGKPGTRTDIWIDCETVCQEKISLCIEVKCSWNREAKTALADQLVAKYMSPGRAEAGILLLAWFHCAAWKVNVKKSVWSSLAEAKADLERQVQNTTIQKPLNVFVLDCTI